MKAEILFLVVTFLSSVAGSISGIGGGVIIKPVLELLSGEGVEVVSFLSGCTVLSMAAVSLIGRRKDAGNFEFRRGTALAAGSALGGVAGKLLFDAIRGGYGGGSLGTAQSALLAAIVAGLLVYQRLRDRFPARDLRGGAVCAALGGAMGLLSAFLGIGGGPFNLALLTFFLSMDNRRVSLHSIYIILFSQTASLLLTLARGNVPVFPPPLLACSIAGGIAGALLGSGLVRRMSNRQIGRLYEAVLVFVLAVSANNLIAYIRK